MVGTSQGAWALQDDSRPWNDVPGFCRQRLDLGVEGVPETDAELPLSWNHDLEIQCSVTGNQAVCRSTQPLSVVRLPTCHSVQKNSLITVQLLLAGVYVE